MTAFEIRVYTDGSEFARDWEPLGYSAIETEQYWDLLGELRQGEILIHLPEWLAEKKTGFVDGGTQTAFIGSLADETEDAIRVTDSAAAQPLIRHAHRVKSLENGLDRLNATENPDPDRLEWLTRRITKARNDLEDRQGVPSLSEEWIPKSQIDFLGRRVVG